MQKDISRSSFDPSQRQYEFQDRLIEPISSSIVKTGTTINSYVRDSQLPVAVSYLIHCNVVEI